MAVMAQVEFHGTHAESKALVTALARNCDCKLGPMGVRITNCAAHEMLLTDQRAIDGLVYARRYWEMHLPGAGKRVIRPND